MAPPISSKKPTKDTTEISLREKMILSSSQDQAGEPDGGMDESMLESNTCAVQLSDCLISRESIKPKGSNYPKAVYVVIKRAWNNFKAWIAVVDAYPDGGMLNIWSAESWAQANKHVYPNFPPYELEDGIRVTVSVASRSKIFNIYFYSRLHSEQVSSGEQSVRGSSKSFCVTILSRTTMGKVKK